MSHFLLANLRVHWCASDSLAFLLHNLGVNYGFKLRIDR